MKYLRPNYNSPEAILMQLQLTGILCDSPSPGTNEQISIEDWNDLVNNG